MEVKILEVRDAGTFMPVICIKPIADNDAQLWLLRRDGYDALRDERCVILIKPQCRGVAYDPYDWPLGRGRTMQVAHQYIESHWAHLNDGDVVDVEYILKETDEPKVSERLTALSPKPL